MSKILPILTNQTVKSFSAMDIETMDFNGKELPISISIKTKNITKIFIIDFKPCFRTSYKSYFNPCSEPCYKPWIKPRFTHNNQHCPLLFQNQEQNKFDNKSLDKIVKDLWDKFFDFILLNCNKDVIFVHNLGNFDGFFIYKALSNRFKPEEVSCLIDNHNKFIQITLEIEKIKFIFKDSYRIFPVSLNDLCDVLSIPGKSSNIGRNSIKSVYLIINNYYLNLKNTLCKIVMLYSTVFINYKKCI
jgi:hypothetical protein